jgi:hypothetical protein
MLSTAKHPLPVVAIIGEIHRCRQMPEDALLLGDGGPAGVGDAVPVALERQCSNPLSGALQTRNYSSQARSLWRRPYLDQCLRATLVAHITNDRLTMHEHGRDGRQDVDADVFPPAIFFRAAQRTLACPALQERRILAQVARLSLRPEVILLPLFIHFWLTLKVSRARLRTSGFLRLKTPDQTEARCAIL